jgi:metal transporter CNNM
VAEEKVAGGMAAMSINQWVSLVVLIMLSGCYSGLNLGVLGLDLKDLELMSKGPYETIQDEKEGQLAKKLLPLRSRGNLLLCAILLGNVLVNSAISIIMGENFSGILALVVSTALIVVFGEIIPQAVCSRYGIQAGAYLAWLLWISIGITFVAAYPIAAILDKVLGAEVGTVLTKSKMKKLFELQESLQVVEDQEGKILRATLELSNREIHEIMTPYENCYMLDIESVIDREVTQEIYTKGYSRIPVYEHGDRQQICGVLMAKDLILFNPDRDQMTIK